MTKLTLKDKMPFGKFKGCLIDRLIPKEDDNFQAFSVFGNGDALKYMNWVKDNCNNIELSSDILQRMKDIAKLRLDNYKPEENQRKGYTLDYYNDMGAMNDLTFQDVYGDFGY